MTRNSLNGIKRNFFHLFAESDPHVRGEILGVIPRLVDRIRAATASLSKVIIRTNDSGMSPPFSVSTRLAVTLNLHKDFVQWLLQFLSAGLRPGAPYQRHISCLKTLLILARSGIDHSIPRQYWSKQASSEISWPFYVIIFTPWLFRSLLDLIMDPFDDVRSLAVTLLEMSSWSGSGFEIYHRNADRSSNSFSHSLPKLVSFISRAEELMLLTGRADHADGVSRAYALLFAKTNNELLLPDDGMSIADRWWCTKFGICQHLITTLKRTLEIGERDLSLAVQRFPLHGTLASFR